LYVNAANEDKRSLTNTPMKSSIRITGLERRSICVNKMYKKTHNKMQKSLKMKKSGTEGKRGIEEIRIEEKSGIEEKRIEEKRIISIAYYYVSKTIISFQ
jgi:hypothetical protein